MSLTIETDLTPLRIDNDGVVRVGESRVTLDLVADAFLGGSTAEEIVEQYPTAPLPDVYAIIAYYLRHRPDIDSYLERHRQEAGRVRRDYDEARYPYTLGFRDRLMARRIPLP